MVLDSTSRRQLPELKDGLGIKTGQLSPICHARTVRIALLTSLPQSAIFASGVSRTRPVGISKARVRAVFNEEATMRHLREFQFGILLLSTSVIFLMLVGVLDRAGF
jgi:hypothetical protein